MVVSGVLGAGATEVVMPGDNVWTLSSTGTGRLTADPSSPEPSGPTQSQLLPAHPIDLGQTTGQGPVDWYVGRLHYRLTLPQELNGILYVSASTNGQTFAQLKYDFRQVKSAGTYSVGTATLLDGGSTRISSDREVEVDFENYLRAAGIKPGLNDFTVQLERIYGANYSTFEVFEDSGVVRTQDNPNDVKVTAASVTQRFEAGSPFKFDLSVEATRVQGGSIAIEPSSGIRPMGTVKLDGHGRARVLGVARRAGDQAISVRVSLPDRRTRVVPIGHVNVAPRHQRNPASLLAFAVAAVIAVLVVVQRIFQRNGSST